jgi:hypothetical protein
MATQKHTGKHKQPGCGLDSLEHTIHFAFKFYTK